MLRIERLHQSYQHYTQWSPHYTDPNRRCYHQFQLQDLKFIGDDISPDYQWRAFPTGLRWRHQQDFIFSTFENIHHLCNADRIYCDGTIYTAPHMFDNIFTIRKFIGSAMFPLVFSPLPKRDKDTSDSSLFSKRYAGATTRPYRQLQSAWTSSVLQHIAVVETFPIAELKGSTTARLYGRRTRNVVYREITKSYMKWTCLFVVQQLCLFYLSTKLRTIGCTLRKMHQTERTVPNWQTM